MKNAMKRWLSLLLTVLMVATALPVAALAEGETAADGLIEETLIPVESEQTTPTVNVSNAVSAAELFNSSAEETSYLEQIAALQAEAEALDAESETLMDDCANIYARLMAIYESVEAEHENGTMTDEEYEAIYNAVGTVIEVLNGYGYDPYAVAEFAENPNQNYWKSSITLYYDTVTGGNYGSSTSNNGYGVEEVSLSSSAVTHGNAGNTSWSGGKTLSTYYPSATTSSSASATLKVTASEGYYVTDVIVACAPIEGNSQKSPFKCSTWQAGKEYSEAFNLSQSTYESGSYTLETSLSSLAFCHDSNNKGTKCYFILIMVAPVPTPLYVAYDYGSIAEHLTIAGTAFANPTWTVASSENSYGTGSMVTDATQFKYAYSSASQVSSWKHVANTVSEEALLAAAEVGYYFTGWKATWYNTCDENFNFSSVYMTGERAAEEQVLLPTHVKLVAQWAPVTLKVTKEVQGLPEDYTTENTYEVAVEGDQNNLNSASLKVKGNGSASETYSGVKPATFKLEETAPSAITIGNTQYNATVTYEPVEKSLTAQDIVGGTHTVELKVINTYSDKPLTTSVTATKVWSDYNNQYSIRPASIELMLMANGQKVEQEGLTNPATVTAGTDGTWSYTWENVPINDADGAAITYTVTETAVPGYTASYSEDGLTVTNTLKTTSVTAKKIWVDEDNKYNIRPNSINLQLMAGGTAFGELVVLREKNNWSYTWENLPECDANGVAITYTVAEISGLGYTSEITGNATDGFTVTNTLDKVSITATKEWNDSENAYNTRPASITLKLMADGVAVDGMTETIAPNTDDTWPSKTWSDLPKYKSVTNADGAKSVTMIVYTVEEEAVAGYETTPGDADNGYKVTNTLKTHNLTIKKTISGNMGTRSKTFNFTTEYGSKSETANLAHDGTATYTVPYGASVKVTEDPEGYTYSLTSVTGVADQDVTKLETGVSFTMPDSDVTVTINNEKEVTVDTGILLDSLPYVLILALVGAALVVWFIRKRRNDD